jgi:hypothetical protein
MGSLCMGNHVSATYSKLVSIRSTQVCHQYRTSMIGSLARFRIFEISYRVRVEDPDSVSFEMVTDGINI